MEYHFSLAPSIHHYSYNFNLGNHRLYKCFLNFDDYVLQLMKTFKSASQKVEYHLKRTEKQIFWQRIVWITATTQSGTAEVLWKPRLL